MQVKAKHLAVEIIKRFEDCKLSAQQNALGEWHVGWNQIGRPGMKMTQEEADLELEKLIEIYILDVLDVCPPLEKESAHRLAACTSLAYSIGIPAFSTSSVCRYTKNGRFFDASNAFLTQVKANGAPLKQIQKRRIAEKNLYEGRQ